MTQSRKKKTDQDWYKFTRAKQMVKLGGHKIKSQVKVVPCQEKTTVFSRNHDAVPLKWLSLNPLIHHTNILMVGYS